MKKQLAIGFVMSLALTPIAFAANSKAVETRKSTESKDLKTFEALRAQNKPEIRAEITKYVVSMSNGRADSTRINEALKQDNFEVIQAEGPAKNFSMISIARELIKKDQELKDARNLSPKERELNDARQGVLKVAPQMIASLAVGNFKSESTGLEKKQAQLIYQQISLLPKILSKYNLAEVKSHLRVMEEGIKLVETSPTMRGDVAFSLAAGRGKLLTEKEIDQKLPCKD